MKVDTQPNISNCLVLLARENQRIKQLKNIKIAIEAVLEVLNQEAEKLGKKIEISKVEVSVLKNCLWFLVNRHLC